MDIQMPVMDGIESTHILRERGYDLPILAMTADVLPEVKKQCKEIGMDAFVSKPFNPNELENILNQYIKTDTPRSSVAPSSAKKSGTVSLLEDPSLIPGVDIPTGVSRMMGNREKYFKLLSKYCQRQKDVTTRCRRLLQEENIDEARKIIHGFKGVSGNLSAVDIFELSQILEDTLKKGELEIAYTLLDRIEEGFTTICSTLASIKQEDSVG